MGQMKELMMDHQEQAEDRKLADVLHITYEELLQLNHKIDTEESEWGVIYQCIVSFSKDAPKEILQKVKGIDANNQVWLDPWELNEDEYYHEQYETIISNEDFYRSFLRALEAAEKLNEVDVDGGELTGVLKRQTYVSVIAALEAFLSETFINLTNQSDVYFRRFIETFPDFKAAKFELSQIFIEQEKLKETAKKVMLEVLYHNLGKVSKMYSATFDIEFPVIADLARAVQVRHDLVHRNGKTRNEEFITIEHETIRKLVENSREFAKDIAIKLKLTDDEPGFKIF